MLTDHSEWDKSNPETVRFEEHLFAIERHISRRQEVNRLKPYATFAEIHTSSNCAGIAGTSVNGGYHFDGVRELEHVRKGLAVPSRALKSFEHALSI